MKNKLFLAGIIIILIFGIIGMGCDGGGGSMGGGGSGGGNTSTSNGGSGSGGGNGGDMSDGNGGSGSGDNSGNDGYDGSGGSGSGNRDPDYNGSGFIFIGGSGSGKGSKSYYTVKFTVTSSDASDSPVKGLPVIIKYSYPNNNFNYNSPYPPIRHTISSNTPWETSVAISSKVIGNGVNLEASIDTPKNTSGDTSDTSGDTSKNIKLTAKIFVDGKERVSKTEFGSVTVNW